MRQLDRPLGFSLVEMMVALLFTLILMAGLATVFRHSLGLFATSGEKISNSRRNRTATDMIYDDLNAAGLLIGSLRDYGTIGQNTPRLLSSSTPAFQIIPNVAYVGTDVASPNNTADQLFLYFDEVMPFEGTQTAGGASMSQLAGDGAGAALSSASPFSYEFRDSQQVDMLESEQALAPLYLIRRTDASNSLKITNLSRSGVRSVNLNVEETGTGNIASLNGSGALFVSAGRYVRYSIRPMNLDPDPENAGLSVPCLVRDEVIYSNAMGSASPFAAPITQTIVAENVVGFQVMVSPDAGATWTNDPNDAGQRDGASVSAATPGLSHTKYKTWAEISALLNSNAAISGRPGPYNRVDDNQFWFKDIPVMLRVDITTRTARARGEYMQNSPNTIINGTRGGAPYKIQTQSVVIVPRHFGLSYNLN